jgi:hypothetical protein
VTARSVWRNAAILLAGLACAGGGGAAGVSAEPPTSPSLSCPPITYHSLPRLKAQRACMNLGVRTHGTRPGTYLFIGPGDLPAKTGVGIFRDNGALVWWQPAFENKTAAVNVVRYRGKRYLAIWAGAGNSQGLYSVATVTLYNEHYQRVGTITSARPLGPDRIDIHEFRITPQGNALFGIDQLVTTKFHGRRVPVYQYIVQEVSLTHGPQGIHTGRLLFQWDSLGHVPLSDSYFPAPTNHQVWDYFHGNAVAQDTDGNLLVSSRHTWAIYKINAKTGRTIWQVGGKGDSRLAVPWCYQHDIVALGHNRYSLFDDGGSGPGCEVGMTGHPARGLTIQVDPSKAPAGVRLIRSVSHNPPIYPLCCGGMQLMPGGGVLIDWGNVPEVSEFGSDGTLRMDLSLSRWSYRASRFAWVGEPLTRPAVASQRSPTATEVWASWNGSTQVTAWRVLAGSQEKHLAPVGPSRPKQGFETEAVLPRSYAYVAVQALGASGHVLSISRPVATSAGS